MEIAHTASRLFTQHGIAISIAIQSATGAARAASPAVLRALAPFLSGIHMYSAPTQHTCSDHHIYEAAYSGFSAAHMAALQHRDASFTAFCVSDRRPGLILASDAIVGNMAHIAQLTNLTKLHLGLCNLQQAADFQQLTQLTKLQDLGVQSYRASASCEAILFSNRHCLRKVNLAARSWTVATYRAL